MTQVLRQAKVLKIGITGNLGSGKSTAGRILTELGVPVLDTDTVVHELLDHDAQVKAEILAYFGPAVQDMTTGALSRPALAASIFGPNDAQHRKALEAILHPRTRARMRAFMAAHAQESVVPAVACLVPLLFENQIEALFDETWLMAIDSDLQRERLKARGMNDAAITARLATQMPQAEKIARADWVVWNNETPQKLSETIKDHLAEKGLII
ncbi:MAG: dephospho-CoA kinase [Vampirovibrionales bacterium]|nr:dephospho-CoA kinase [Vampirovibrionales bacterium]